MATSEGAPEPRATATHELGSADERGFASLPQSSSDHPRAGQQLSMAQFDLPSPQEREALRQLCVALAQEAGRLIMSQRPEALGVAATKSSEVDVVTVMDQRSETLLRERIAEARPDDAILGEEEGVSPGTSGLTWVVDPIDGTVNYLYEQPLFAVSVACVVGDPTTPGAWMPVAGAVDAPVLRQTFHAAHELGASRMSYGAAEIPEAEKPESNFGTWVSTQGATLSVTQAVAQSASNDDESNAASGTLSQAGHARIQPNLVDRLELALIGTGFSYSSTKRAEQAEVLGALLPRVRDIRRGGSAALDLCFVASGQLDAYYESGINPWDQAAGQVIAQEAGAEVFGPAGGYPGRELVVASAPGIAKALEKELQAALTVHPK